MSLKVGDPIFLGEKGTPGYVTRRNENSLKLDVNSQEAFVQEHNKHGYIKGLSPEDRDSLNTILDIIALEQNPHTKFENLQTLVNTLEQENDMKNVQLIKYLKSELGFMMHSQNIKPKTYQIPFDIMK